MFDCMGGMNCECLKNPDIFDRPPPPLSLIYFTVTLSPLRFNAFAVALWSRPPTYK